MSAKLLFLVIIVIASYKEVTLHEQYTVYVKSDSGTVNTSCWTEGVELPCHKLELTLKQASQLNNKVTESAKHSELEVSSLHEAVDDRECPTWMYYSNDTDQCMCGADHYDTVKCNATLNETYILDCHQMSFDDKLQRVIAGLSFYGCLNQAQPGQIYHQVPANRSQINEVMCNHFSREGRLCGACKKGYSPLVYSYQLHCKQCSEVESKGNWVKFMAVAFIPLTVFYIFVVSFKFNANSPQLHGFVIYAQFVASPANIRVITSGWRYHSVPLSLSKLLATSYGIWNLDYLRTVYPDICLRITTLQALSLDYIVAYYPLFLIMLTYVAIKLHSRECRIVVWIWKPIKRCLLKLKDKDNIKTSMIDVFATFLLLSYNKILSVNFDLVAFTVPIDSSGKNVGRYLYYDASYEHFGPDHLPYGILALLSLTIFNVLPFLLLLFYPMKWFQRCLNHIKLSHLALHKFVDSFAVCYKDGTEPKTRDYRYFAALFLFIRISSYAVYQATLTASFYGWNGLILAGFTILLMITQPYKSIYGKYNTVTTVMFGVMTMTAIALMNINNALVKEHQAVKTCTIIVAVLIVLPQLYIIGTTIKWIYNRKIIRKLLLSKPTFDRSLSESSLLIASENQTTQTYKSLSSNI